MSLEKLWQKFSLVETRWRSGNINWLFLIFKEYPFIENLNSRDIEFGEFKLIWVLASNKDTNNIHKFNPIPTQHSI